MFTVTQCLFFSIARCCCRYFQQFNSIGDFAVENKCVHVQDGCHLHTMHSKKEICEKSTKNDNNKELTNANYITANCLVHKSFERSNIADSSVLSLKNYSTILHNTLYKIHSPNSVSKSLERQTSTPMHIDDNLVALKSPELSGCSCSISSGLSQMSSIHSSSESDISPQACTKTTETR